MRVLLVEDDRMIGEALERALKRASYACDWVDNGPSAIGAIQCHEYALILLDLGLPGLDGYGVLRHVQAAKAPLPVVVVSARDAIADRLRSLDGGADDYVLKPFDMEELLARMRAVLRRKGEVARPVKSNGELSLDPVTHQITYRDVESTLTSREFSLVDALLHRPGAILSRHALEQRIYGWNEEVDSNAIEFLIHSVRKKLGATAIRNVRGVGWMVPAGT